MISVASRISMFVDRTLEVVTGVLFAVMMADVCFGIADRYVFGIGAAWPEEVGRYLLIWVSFLAAAILVKHQEHFGVLYFVDSWAPQRLKRGLRLFTDVMTFGVGVGFLAAGGPLIETGALQISPGSGIPMSWVFASLPVSGAFITYYSILHAMKELRARGTGCESGPEVVREVVRLPDQAK